MSTVANLFEQLKQIESENVARADSIRAKIAAELNDVWDDWQALRSEIQKLIDCDRVEYFGDAYGDIHAFVRFDLSAVVENEREYLEGYLVEHGVSADWENNCLTQCLGNDCLIIQDDSRHRQDNGVWQGFKRVIDEEQYRNEDGEVNEALRNELIEQHMERSGCFPGVFRVTQHGDVHPISVAISRTRGAGIGTRTHDRRPIGDQDEGRRTHLFCLRRTLAMIGRSDLITSSGIVRDRETPRVGVVSARSLSTDLLDTFICDGVDLGWEQALLETRDAARVEGKDPDEAEAALSDSCFESPGPYLLGYRQLPTGLYEPDPAAEFSATYNPESGNVTVEASQHTARCHHTSPCYVMADGRGPCGDLDTPGDSVIAYTLPVECWRQAED